MESEGLLLLSKYLATCPFPWPDEPSPPSRTYFFQIHFIIILPSISKSLKRLICFRFPHQNHARICGLPHACNIYLPFRPCLLHHSMIFWRLIKITKTFITLFYSVSSYFFLPKPKGHPQHLQPTFFAQCTRQSFTRKQKKG